MGLPRKYEVVTINLNDHARTAEAIAGLSGCSLTVLACTTTGASIHLNAPTNDAIPLERGMVIDNFRISRLYLTCVKKVGTVTLFVADDLPR